jgi:hypothetical protein
MKQRLWKRENKENKANEQEINQRTNIREAADLDWARLRRCQKTSLACHHSPVIGCSSRLRKGPIPTRRFEEPRESGDGATLKAA